MDNKKGITRREFFSALCKRAVEEVKAGYQEGLAAQTAKTKAPAPR